MSSPSIIFGLSPFPRPPKTGYFYYKLPPKFSEWNVRTIAVLDLYNTDEEYLSNIFEEGIKKMLHREHLSGEVACSVLEKYDTENIREFAQEIFEEVVQGYVLKIRSTYNDPQIPIRRPACHCKARAGRLRRLHGLREMDSTLRSE